MVFETIAVELINRYLGTFVENLDTSQLKIGLWGGDVVLNKLNLKENALDDMDLPIKIKAGHIEKLTLKIPWKNLYSEAVVAQIEGVYALVVPNIGITYDAAKEFKAKQELKQAILTKIDEQKKLEAEKDKPKEVKNDSFVEKLATQVIKNLQIKVSLIHIRYEDKYSNPARPVSMGITLNELLFQTTDSNWKEMIIKEAVTQIYKLVRLDSLCVYWNSNGKLLQDLDKKLILQELHECIQTTLKDNIAKQGMKPNLQYLFKPISAVAHLRLNTKPEQTDFSLPKIFLTLVFDEIAVSLSKDQYDDILEILEAMERMNLMAMYKKTRPAVSYKGHAKQWWHHAYAVILEHNVQRRRKMWNWNVMKEHRDKLKLYRELYKQKLENKKMSYKDQGLLKQCEEDLDVFNISMCRNQAEMDVIKRGKKRDEEKSQASWFGGWFAPSKKKASPTKKPGSEKDLEDFGNKFQEEFTPEEKNKLYNAIGYDENAKDPTFPIEYVAVRLVTKLNKLSVSLVDNRHKKDDHQVQLMKLSLTEICASFGQRPAANAVRLDAKVDKLRITGLPRKEYIPRIVSSVGVSKEENVSLLTILFETNPLDGQCDSRVRVQFRPLEIIFDAITVNALSSFFMPPESVRLKQLSNAAMSKYDDIKAQTSAGVMYMVNQRKYADIDIHLMPSYIIVPETGEIKKDVNMILLNLGQLKVTSQPHEITQGKQMSPEEMVNFAFDKFIINLDNLQLLFLQPGDVWHDESVAPHSPMYILRPLSLRLLLEKCIFDNDANLPKIRISAELPLLSVYMSDTKLLAIMKLASSIPLPESGSEVKSTVPADDAVVVDSPYDMDLSVSSMRGDRGTYQGSEYTNQTQLMLSFMLKQISVEILETVEEKDIPFLKLTVNKIGVDMKARTFDLTVDGYLGGIYLQHMQYKVSEGIRTQLQKCEVTTGELINIINSPYVDEDDPLLSIHFLQANKKGPEFATTYGKIAQSITVEFSTLDLVLHQGVILSLLAFAQKFESPEEAVIKPIVTPVRSIAGSSTTLSVRNKESLVERQIKKDKMDMMLLKFRAIVNSIQLSICNETCLVMHSKIEGVEVGAKMHVHKMGVSALMRKIELLDPDPRTKYPKIFSVSGEEMFKFEMVQYNHGTAGHRFDNISAIDMDIFLQLGKAQLVFVNKFVLSLLNFLDNFNLAKAKLDEASQAVKEASLDVAKNFQEKAPRIKLEISLKAPLLVIPKSSRSKLALIINLGDINLVNKFEKLYSKTKTVPGQAHIVEHLVVMLTNLQFCRGSINNLTSELYWELPIIEPLTFQVNIHRNLSSGWFHGIPDMEIAALLDKISIKLNKEDISLMLSILVGNLKEQNPEDPTTLKIEKPSKEARSTDHALRKKAERGSTDSQASAKSDTLGEEIYSTLKVDFKLQAINVELYRGRCKADEGEKVRPKSKMLSQMCLTTLLTEVNMMSDESMSAKVGLVDFRMDDCRIEKDGGITKLIRRTAYKYASKEVLESQTSEDESKMFINIHYDLNKTMDKKVVFKICSLHICICMEFIMKVVDFFVNSMPSIKTNEKQMIVKKTHPKSEAPVPPPPPEPFVGSMDVTFKLEKPEIYLIEDQMNPHTNSMIVDVKLDFRLRMSADVISVQGSVENLSLVTCIFGQLETRQSVLEPVNITLMSNSPQGKDHHVNVNVSDFIVTISPSTIRLLSTIATNMAVQSLDDETDLLKLKDMSNIWAKSTIAEKNFWFINAEIGSSVDSGVPATVLNDTLSTSSRGELIILEIPVVVMKLEGGVGHRTVPLLIVESSFECQVHNWSSDLFFESSLSMEVAYNNEHIGVWEPILEPVTAKGKQPHKWELSVEMVKSEQVTIHDEEDMSILPPPKLTINIAAIEPLQIIMTKSCLEVLSNLGEAFGQAYNLKEMEGTLGQKIVPYVFQNLSGKDLGIQLDASLKLSSENEHSNLDKIPTFTSIMVDNNEKTLVKQLSIIRSTQQQQDKRVIFFISGQQKNKKHETSIKQARKSVFVFDNWNIMVNVDSHIGQKTITFSSCIQIMNHMCVGMELFYVDSHDKVSCGVVKPDSTFYLPLNVVYSHGRTIFFKPKQLEESSGSIACNYDVSQSGVSLDVMPTEPGKVKEIHCSCSTAPNQSFYFNVMPEQEKIFTNNTEDKTSTMTIFHIKPTVIIHNQLPLNITYSLDADAGSVQELPSGQLLELHNAAVNTTTLNLQIPNYRGFTWKGKKIIKLDVPELSVWTFESSDNDNKIYMDLGLHCKEKNGSFDMTIYCPYWIINLSTRTIALKEDDKEAPFVQQGTDDSIMLFYFRDKPLFGSNKRKVMLKVADSEWSDKFSLDTVGTGGSVSCKHKAAGNVSEVGLSIQLTSSGLTKIVTFTPFYLFLNLATIPLCIQEVGFDVITVVQPEECKAFYPKSSGKEMKIQVKPEDGELFTAPFFLNKAHSTLLKLEDKYGGIQAECQVSESSMITTLKIYMKGMATVMFVNHTSQCNILVRQSGSKEVEMTLEPQTTQLYTWNNPTGNREILWTCGNKKDAKNSLDRDHIEEFFAENDVKVYFVSFLDGLQRVAMFTQDLALATLAQEAGELEQADQEINLKIHDMGFSLINNKKMVEVAYMGITSSGVIWEEKKKKYKAMKLKDTIVLETAYQKYLMDVEMGKSREAVTMLENKLEVDFTNMMLIKPKACGLRRSFENGIWVQVRTSPHSMQFHAKINRLQFDNQLRHAVFPTVLSPLPPPKSVAADSVPKPFIEVSLMNRIHEHSNLVQIKYFKVLIQEMNLKVDQGFLMEILDLFSSDAQPKRDQEEIYFKTDIDCTKMNLKEVAGVSIQAQRVSFYDYFHVSPIKIHISFSIQGGSQSNSYQANILGVFLQSVGVVLTDVQDVVFKLGFFERNHSFYTKTQLTSEFVRHYSGQAVKQMYVLVLGLDVLGNPFGLLRGLSEGIEDLFYEPYQGAIQGPEEFAEGLALGVRSLFGHAVGGTAGAVSRITGTLGKGLAALTLDEDYQKKRREQLNKRPATAREGFARGGKGLVMGVFDGVTGIVRKPVEGAKQEGFTGFFKGVGKGLVGVVTRPTSGVVDFASSSLEGIRRITDMSDEIHRLRPPRRFNKDGIIRPYIQEEAEGYNLLLETDKGKYVDSDEYVQHYKMKEDGKIVFIITDKRIMLAKRGELFGSWDTEWVFTFQELKAAPKLSAKGIEILLKDKEKKKLFGSNVTKKDLIIADAAAAQIILTKIIETMESERVESGV